MELFGKQRISSGSADVEARAGLIVFFLVSLFLLLSSLYAAEASVLRKARESVLEAAAPALELLSGPIALLEDLFGDVGDYFRVLEQNKSLREENAQLRQWQEEARSLRQVLAAYEALKIYEPPPQIRPVNAFVIGESNEAFRQSMILNVGSDDGVAHGQAVVSDRGLIGRIIDVSRHAARTLLLNDAQSRVPVFVEGAAIEAILVGRTTGRPSLAVTLERGGAGLEVGQRVVTSGAGGVLPSGLLVGVVARVDDRVTEIELAASHTSTRMVRVLNYEFPTVDEAEAAENAARAAAPRPLAVTATGGAAAPAGAALPTVPEPEPPSTDPAAAPEEATGD